MSVNFGADVAFLALGGVLILVAVTVKLAAALRRNRIKSAREANIEGDPLSDYIPESLKENPVLQKLLMQVSETPIAATVSAVTIGILISRELFED